MPPTHSVRRSVFSAPSAFICAAFLLSGALPAAAQYTWSDSAVSRDYRDLGPLFWLPDHHENWPRLASEWLPRDACNPGDGDDERTSWVYATVHTDFHNESCPGPNGRGADGLPSRFVVWHHRKTRDKAVTEFSTGSSFDHSDLNDPRLSGGTSRTINPWHWRLTSMPESQRCFPADRELAWQHAMQPGWGGFQMQQHVGEWYQGQQYWPDYKANAVPGIRASAAETARIRFGTFDFDVYSRPGPVGDGSPRRLARPTWNTSDNACAAAAVYDQYATGAGGNTRGTPKRCASDAGALLMRANSELRCEPDLKFYDDREAGSTDPDDVGHPYLKDFKTIFDRYQRPGPAAEDRPIQRDNWWPPPPPSSDDYFGYSPTFDFRGEAIVIREFLGIGPITPEFPANWDEECDVPTAALGNFGCGPGTDFDGENGGRGELWTELKRRRHTPGSDQGRREWGARPLFRRFEVQITRPGETVNAQGPRSFPGSAAGWGADYQGYLTPTAGGTARTAATPNAVSDTRVATFQDSGEPEFGSGEWLDSFLTYDDPADGSTKRFSGGEISDALEYDAWMASTAVDRADDTNNKSFALSDCVRFLPTDRSAADQGAASTDFWNQEEWRECAAEAYDSAPAKRKGPDGAVTTTDVVGGGTARQTSGTLAVNTWLRHRGDDPDSDRDEEVSPLELDAQGWALENGEKPGETDGFGVLEIPERNRDALNTGFNLDENEHVWYRTSGSELSCLWGGMYVVDLPASAKEMHDRAADQVYRLLPILKLIDETRATEASETTQMEKVGHCEQNGHWNEWRDHGCVSDTHARKSARWWWQERSRLCACVIPSTYEPYTWHKPAPGTGRTSNARFPNHPGGNTGVPVDCPKSRQEIGDRTVLIKDIIPSNPPARGPNVSPRIRQSGAACPSGVKQGAENYNSPAPQGLPPEPYSCMWGPTEPGINRFHKARRRTEMTLPDSSCQPRRCWDDTYVRARYSCPAAQTCSNGDTIYAHETCPVPREPCQGGSGPENSECPGASRPRSSSHLSGLGAPAPSGGSDGFLPIPAFPPLDLDLPPNVLRALEEGDYVVTDAPPPLGVDSEVVLLTISEPSPADGADPSDPSDSVGAFSSGSVGSATGSGSGPSGPVILDRAPALGRASSPSASAVARASLPSSAGGGFPLLSASAEETPGRFSTRLPGTAGDAFRAAQDVGLQYAGAPVTPADLRSGVRAMRDGIALSTLDAANRASLAFEDPAGLGPRADVVGGLVEHEVRSRSGDRAFFSAAVGLEGPLAAPSGARDGVFAAAAAGNNAAAGGWYGWEVAGSSCAGGAECGSAMTEAFRFTVIPPPGVDWTDDISLCNQSSPRNIGVNSVTCHAWLLSEYARVLGLIMEAARNMMGWRAIMEYRTAIRSAVLAGMAPYQDWTPGSPTAMGGSMPNVPASSYVPFKAGARLDLNPICLYPEPTISLPVHGIADQKDVFRGSGNEHHAAALFDRGGGLKNAHLTTERDVWPPTESLIDVYLPEDATLGNTGTRTVPMAGGTTASVATREICFPDGLDDQGDPKKRCTAVKATTVKQGTRNGNPAIIRSILPGRFDEGIVVPGVRETFYGTREPDSDPNTRDPEAFGRFGIGTAKQFGHSHQTPEDDLPRTMREDDHLAGSSTAVSPVAFREFSCPAPDEPGTYATIRPIVCHDGTVRSAYLLADHKTACSAGEAGCARRISLWEPVTALGGAGFDPTRTMGVEISGEDEDVSFSDFFGPDYLHMCLGTGPNPTIGKGRAKDPKGGTDYRFYSFQKAASPTATHRGTWVAMSGLGDDPHGHDPEEGYYPRAGEYTDQDGNKIWFEPFAAYDNYDEMDFSGDYGASEPITKGEGLFFGEHEEESRILKADGTAGYDEFVITPYQIKARMMDYRLWGKLEGGTVVDLVPEGKAIPDRGLRSSVDVLPGIGRISIHPELRHQIRNPQSLMFGWPSFDLWDDKFTHFHQMAIRRGTALQQLYGLAPGAAEAEQIWVRRSGPLGFFGAARIGNATSGDSKGGCLIEVNPPADAGGVTSKAQHEPFRRVLDPIAQAWCVVEKGVVPSDSCVSLP